MVRNSLEFWYVCSSLQLLFTCTIDNYSLIVVILLCNFCLPVLSTITSKLRSFFSATNVYKYYQQLQLNCLHSSLHFLFTCTIDNYSSIAFALLCNFCLPVLSTITSKRRSFFSATYVYIYNQQLQLNCIRSTLQVLFTCTVDNYS